MADLPRKEYFAQLHKLPVAAGALIFNQAGKILLLKPVYRDNFLIPGGMVEIDESPSQALVREVKEEINLEISPRALLCVDYKPSVTTDFNDATIQFVFDGGILSDEQIKNICINPKEHSEYAFYSAEEMFGLCSSGLENRILESIRAKENDSVAYLENGKEL